MKRFSETLKWDDPWFRALPGPHKLAFLYIIDRCDNAGFWEVDMEAMAFHTKMESRALEVALKGLARSIEESNGWVWAKNFLRHQKNDSLNTENPAHRQVIGLIKAQAERFPSALSFLPKEGASKGLQSPIGKGIGKGNGKGEGKEGEKTDKARATIEDLKAFTVELGLPATDGEFMFHHWENNGWKNGSTPVKDWKAGTRKWKSAGWLPSQKNPAAPADKWVPLFPGHIQGK